MSDGLDDRAPEDLFAEASTRLLATLDPLIVPWVERCVASRLGQGPDNWDAETAQAVDAAGRAAHEMVMPRLTELLARDAADQASNPLTVLREAVCHPTAVLEAREVPEVRRDEFDRRAFPDDRYALSPAGFRDIDESLHEVGLLWGAAKAHLILSRRH